MKTAIFYFSGTGNTWFIADGLRKSLEKRRVDVEFVSVEEHLSEEDVKAIIDGSDKILIGYPIYGSLAPRIMEEFMDKLPAVKGKSMNVFTTVALYSGDGPIYKQELFEAKGYKLDVAMEFIMNNNFNVPGFPDVLHVGDSEKIEKRHTKSLARIEVMVDRMLKNEKYLQGSSAVNKYMGRTQRKHVEKYIVKINESLMVDQEKCVNCGKCIRICPAQNIYDKDGNILFKDKCMGCIRCYHQCPVSAINITEKSKDTSKWKRFKGIYKGFEKELK